MNTFEQMMVLSKDVFHAPVIVKIEGSTLIHEFQNINGQVMVIAKHQLSKANSQATFYLPDDPNTKTSWSGVTHKETLIKSLPVYGAESLYYNLLSYPSLTIYYNGKFLSVAEAEWDYQDDMIPFKLTDGTILKLYCDEDEVAIIF